MNASLKTVMFALAAILVLGTGTAFAQRPATLANTNWTLQTNVGLETLVITTQGGPGAPGAAECRHVNGELGTVGVKVRGWYCPSTGRIHLIHRNLDSGDAVRVFTGNVSEQVAGQPLYMAGTMTVLISAFGNLGEYNFSAVTF
jgi:hypothetical protein